MAARAIRGQVAVAEPSATLPVDSDRIVIRTGPEAVAYLSGAQWAERLPKLVQNRLITSMETSQGLKSVVRPGQNADNNLITELRRFEIDLATGEAIVEMSAKLVSDKNGRVKAAKLFLTRTPAPSKGPALMAAALDRALGDCLRQLVVWTGAQL